MVKPKRIFLHTGSNLGNKKLNLTKANAWIELYIGKIIRFSKIYETEPWGKSDQPDFINQALEVETFLGPEAVLDAIFEIETKMGRVRTEKWSSRVIDIDILFYEQEIIDSPRLIIPHKHLHERNFVLVPMKEIAPNFVHPIFNLKIDELYLRTEDPLKVFEHKEKETDLSWLP